MEQFPIARIRSSCIESAIVVSCIAIVLGLLGALVVRPEPELEPYWHGASLLVIALAVILRSAGLIRMVWKEMALAEQG